jgi:hypothetical protein
MSKLRQFSWLYAATALGAALGSAACSDASEPAYMSAATDSATTAGTGTNGASSAPIKMSPGKAGSPTTAASTPAPAPASGPGLSGAMASPMAPAAGSPAAATPPPSGSAPSGERADSDDSAAGADDEDEEARPGDGSTQSGLLTAGAWDDNLNYDRFRRYRARLQQAGLAGVLPSTDEEHDDAHDKFSRERDARSVLDISLVIDTTGSMGDEIGYLQTEFLALSQSIEDLYPDSDQRWSLVVYRDVGDAYLTQEYDFDGDVGTFRDQLDEQAANGGGDFPEAPDAAFAAMTNLDWRDGDDVARLVFWVADAPHHEQNAQAMTEAIRDSAELDVHVYPVASSGVDELTELTMRSAAQLTGGRYLFLTNDSGVGGEHKEPTIPCYFVTRLDTAILRMVDIELSGVYHEPAADEVRRTGGDPKSGRCTLESGENVQSF